MADKSGYSFRYKENLLSKILALPSLSEASAEDLRVLLALLHHGCDSDKDTLLSCAQCSEDELLGALQFWRGAGLLVLSSRRKQQKEEKEDAPALVEQKKKTPLRSADALYEATSKELAAAIKRSNLKPLIDACQQAAGKVLNTAEINVIVGMHDQLSLEGDYILMLVSHCYEMGKRSMKYVEKMAFSLCEDGISTFSALENYLDQRRKFASFEWQIKKMMGMGDRDFSKKQRTLVDKWETEYKYGIEIIGLAYDIMADRTNKVSFSYIDAILSNWAKNSLHTESEISEFEEQEKSRRAADKEKKSEKSQKTSETKQKSSVGYNSFDVDDFFSRAVERSYKKKDKRD